MSIKTIENYIHAALGPYDHTPSLKTVAVGLGFGALTAVTTYFLFENSAYLRKAFADVELLPQTNSKPLFYGLALCIGVAIPLFEEAQHRSKLSSSPLGVLTNILLYGAPGFFTPGSVELRVSRIFISMLGGSFYCAAQLFTDDVWAPGIAHTLVNLFALKSYF